jgi:hypothetical protein
MLQDFLAGAITMGFAVCGLFFLKFWRATRDGLFLGFAGAFFLLGIGQAALTFSKIPAEERSFLFLIRLAAFLLIIFSVWLKNRRYSNDGFVSKQDER